MLHRAPMFIEFTWKNKDGKTLKTLINHTKAQTFVDAFVQRGVEPHVSMPDEVVLSNQIDILTLQQR